MKKIYMKPNSDMVRVNLLGTVLGNETLGGQTHNPVRDDVDPRDVEFSAKGQDFIYDEDETWGNTWK